MCHRDDEKVPGPQTTASAEGDGLVTYLQSWRLFSDGLNSEIVELWIFI